jgi:hypothetical protein
MTLTNIREQGLAPTQNNRRSGFVGGCPCGRMPVWPMTNIREQGLAPTK